MGGATAYLGGATAYLVGGLTVIIGLVSVQVTLKLELPTGTELGKKHTKKISIRGGGIFNQTPVENRVNLYPYHQICPYTQIQLQ